MTSHTIRAFEEELQTLTRRLAQMGGMAEKAVSDAVNALVRRNTEQAQQVVVGDSKIDALQRSIEETAILMIARRQPMAADLREIVAAMRISNDLERIGDLAKNIAKRALAMNDSGQPQKQVLSLESLSHSTLEQLKNVLDAYVQKNDAKAMTVWSMDGSIDALYTSIFRELLTYMMEDPRNITPCTHLLFTAKNIERIGDHATNIAETIHYLITGHPPGEERSKLDEFTPPA